MKVKLGLENLIREAKANPETSLDGAEVGELLEALLNKERHIENFPHVRAFNVITSRLLGDAQARQNFLNTPFDFVAVSARHISQACGETLEEMAAKSDEGTNAA